MKRIFAILFAIVLCASLMMTAFADTDFVPVERTLPLVVDNADLLTSDEENQLCTSFEALIETYQIEAAVVTVTDLEYKSPQTYADDFYDYNGYGYGDNDDGILVLYKDGVPGDRELYITTHGTAIDIFYDNEIGYMLSLMQDYIVNENYYGAFVAFADECDYMLYDYYNANVDFIWIPICLLIGFVIALIITAIQKAGLKSVRNRYNATEYVRQGSMNLTNQQDIFLYRNIRRTAIPKNNSSSTHRSSSGRTHGGGGSSF